MNRFKRWLVAIIAPLLLLGVSLGNATPAQAATGYWNEDVWMGVVGTKNDLTDCNTANHPVFVNEDQVGFEPAAQVGTDQAIQYFWELFRNMPKDTAEGIVSMQALIDEGKSYGYDMRPQEACLANIVAFGTPNVANAVPVAQRAVVRYYATIEVTGSEVVVTPQPQFDNVVVQSATLDENGKPAVTIQVADEITGQVYTYISSYPPLVAVTPPPSPDPDPTPTPTLKQFSKAVAPSISGTAAVGKALTAKVAAWVPSATFAWQWYKNGEPIAGATTRTYKLTAADVAAVISVQATGSRAGYASAVKVSKPTKTVAPGHISRGKVKATGIKRVGSPLTAATTGWPAAATLHYQWVRKARGKKSWVTVDGATTSTYTLTQGDLGAKFRVRVFATADGYNPSAIRASASTSAVKAGPPPASTSAVKAGPPPATTAPATTAPATEPVVSPPTVTTAA